MNDILHLLALSHPSHYNTKPHQAPPMLLLRRLHPLLFFPALLRHFRAVAAVAAALSSSFRRDVSHGVLLALLVFGLELL